MPHPPTKKKKKKTLRPIFTLWGGSFAAAQSARGGQTTSGYMNIIPNILAIVSRCDPFVRGSRAATLRVAGAPEGCRFAAAGPDNVRQTCQTLSGPALPRREARGAATAAPQ